MNRRPCRTYLALRIAHGSLAPIPNPVASTPWAIITKPSAFKMLVLVEVGGVEMNAPDIAAETANTIAIDMTTEARFSQGVVALP